MIDKDYMISIVLIKPDRIVIKKDDVYFKLTPQQVPELIAILQQITNNK